MDFSNTVQMAKSCVEMARSKGFYDDWAEKGIKNAEDLDKADVSLANEFLNQRLNLIRCEIGELYESFREGKIQPEEMPTVENYKEKGKGYCSEEFADIIIRIYDLIGFLEYDYTEEELKDSQNISEDSELHCMSTFDTFINTLYRVLGTSGFSEFGVKNALIAAMSLCVGFSKNNFKIDIEKHIKLKYDYNATRPQKHGKNF